MRILIASSEVHPYSKTGGLADMVGALAKFLARAGHEVDVVTPLYGSVKRRFPKLELMDWQLAFPMGNHGYEEGEVWVDHPSSKLRILFVRHDRYFDRPDLYQFQGRDYGDNAERFIFFSKAVVNLARYLPKKPDIVHVHDWQVGLVPLLMLNQEWREGWTNAPRSCLTIHNLAYQGVFDATNFAWTNLPWDYFKSEGVEFYGKLNCLKSGIQFADRLTTVSPRYAEEILEEPLGCGLSGLLLARKKDLLGILNGVDYTEWNTTRNPHLKHPYSKTRLGGKEREKLRLQEELGLEVDADIPLFGNVSRFVGQKGSDLILQAIQALSARKFQFVALGSGEAELEKGFRTLAEANPGRVAVRVGYDHALSHRIEAACDFFLMPSRFEPCGLNQMYSLRYGTIPIVRATGGLDDSVVDATENLNAADGIKFIEATPEALAKAMRKALALYESREWLAQFRKRAMTVDFSWSQTAEHYLDFYKTILG